MLASCRLCHSASLVEVLDFGTLDFTGVFPLPDEQTDKGRLALAVCDSCGLAQLADSFDPDTLYGDNYGYRSGLNPSMVRHLERTTARLEATAGLCAHDVVLDIGSNDGTLLRSYARPDIQHIGIDPTAAKFREFYPDDPAWTVVPDFFSAENFDAVSDERATLVTSIAMFYDLEDPVRFAQAVHHVLADDGLWHLEVAYAPTMLRTGAYDTICHEHLEYYSLVTLKRILDEAGFLITDVVTNAVNGGSISVTAAKVGSKWAPELNITAWLLAKERQQRVTDPMQWKVFAHRVRQQQADLLGLLSSLKVNGASISALGASTKGNVLLQTTGIGTALVDRVGDVNPYKYGRVTPGTGIPIVSEAEVLFDQPDYLLVLPWHFRETFMANLAPYLARGGRLIFPLPDIEIVG